MSRSILILIISTAFPFRLASQEIKPLQDIFLEAEYFFMNKDYSDALPYYLKLYKDLPENANIAYRIGTCYLNIKGEKNLSVDYLEAAIKKISAKITEGSVTQTSAPYDALYELGESYQVNYMFDKAKEAFTKYLGTLLPEDRENRDFVNQKLKSCETAKEFLKKPVSFKTENAGVPFNDENANFNPVISSDGKTFVFMVSLKFYDAVMLSRLLNGKWTYPVNITPELLSDGNMFISCLSPDGKILFLSKNDNYNSDIFSSSYDGIMWRPPVKLNKNINTRYWESHGFMSEDGESLIFASDRPGGFGGLDLYISKKVDGDWGPAVNLGPQINTPFNEDRPFLINSGKTLFFCSQGHISMGGYDLFRSDFQPNKLWNTPENLGYPLNTPDDDVFFMPVGNGRSGFYSVFNESEGAGKEDIYRITFDK